MAVSSSLWTAAFSNSLSSRNRVKASVPMATVWGTPMRTSG